MRFATFGAACSPPDRLVRREFAPIGEIGFHASLNSTAAGRYHHLRLFALIAKSAEVA